MAREAPALVTEKNRLKKIGGAFLGIIGNASHSFGYHLEANDLPTSDYSMSGANKPIADWSASCAIDIGMGWKASRTWLRWLITEIREDRITGVSEVIGSYDGRNVRYWSDSSGWGTNGEAYQGEGHDTWTHVGIYRNNTTRDRGILLGWTANGHEGDDDMPTAKEVAEAVHSYRIDKIDKKSGTQSWMKAASFHAYNHEYAKQQLEQGKQLLAGQAAVLSAIKGGSAVDIQKAVQAVVDKAAAAEKKDRAAEFAQLRADIAASAPAMATAIAASLPDKVDVTALGAALGAELGRRLSE